MDLVQVRQDIVRQYSLGEDRCDWDSDFVLHATTEEILAYAMSFHGLAPDYRRATLMVAEFSSLFDMDGGFADWFGHEVMAGNNPPEYDAEVFAHVCISIYAQSVGQIPAGEGS